MYILCLFQRTICFLTASFLLWPLSGGGMTVFSPNVQLHIHNKGYYYPHMWRHIHKNCKLFQPDSPYCIHYICCITSFYGTLFICIVPVQKTNNTNILRNIRKHLFFIGINYNFTFKPLQLIIYLLEPTFELSSEQSNTTN